jgi:hypothetical protein
MSFLRDNRNARIEGAGKAALPIYSLAWSDIIFGVGSFPNFPPVQNCSHRFAALQAMSPSVVSLFAVLRSASPLVRLRQGRRNQCGPEKDRGSKELSANGIERLLYLFTVVGRTHLNRGRIRHPSSRLGRLSPTLIQTRLDAVRPTARCECDTLVTSYESSSHSMLCAEPNAIRVAMMAIASIVIQRRIPRRFMTRPPALSPNTWARESAVHRLVKVYSKR